MARGVHPACQYQTQIRKANWRVDLRRRSLSPQEMGEAVPPARRRGTLSYWTMIRWKMNGSTKNSRVHPPKSCPHPERMVEAAQRRNRPGHQPRAATRKGSGMWRRRRRRHGPCDQTTQRRLQRSRNCVLLADGQPRRGRDHCGRADVDVPNPADQGLHHGRRGNNSRAGQFITRSRKQPRLRHRGKARSLRQTEPARCRLVNLGRRGDYRSRARWYAQSRRPADGRERHHRRYDIRSNNIGLRRSLQLDVGRFDSSLRAFWRYPNRAAARGLGRFPEYRANPGRVAAQSRERPVRLVVGKASIFEHAAAQGLILRTPGLRQDHHNNQRNHMAQQ